MVLGSRNPFAGRRLQAKSPNLKDSSVVRAGMAVASRLPSLYILLCSGISVQLSEGI